MTECLIFIIKSPVFLFVTIILSLIVKIYLLAALLRYGLRTTAQHHAWFFIVGVLIGTIFCDIAWLVKLTLKLNFASYSYSTLVFFARLSWGFLILQYQALALFMQSLTTKKFVPTPLHKILGCISICFAAYFFFEAFFDSALTDKASRDAAQALPLTNATPLEVYMVRYVAFYLLNFLMFPGLVVTLWRLYTTPLPKILKRQFTIVLLYFIGPYVFSETLQAASFIFPAFQFNFYPIVAFSTILITCAIAYCIPKVMGLRFLNFDTHVHSLFDARFINDFKKILENLSHSNTIADLTQHTQHFFYNVFGIDPRKITFIVRQQNDGTKDFMQQHHHHRVEEAIEHFLSTHHETITTHLQQRRIFVYDELEFSNFYEDIPLRKTTLDFMKGINADIFLPIYEKNIIIAYIIIEQNARKHEFYGDTEQDEILIFARYLGSILNLMQHRNLKTLLYKEKELKEELYNKCQEINQYKESIKSFLRDTPQKEIGIIFYKNKKFILGNKVAKQLIPINLNMHEGHPLTKEIKRIINTVSAYKTPHMTLTTAMGKKMVLYAVPNLEHNTIILMVYYPEISDLITRNIALLKDPTSWDYLLYLETTQSGKLINQLIPSSGHLLINFKIDLLKLALNKKAILLNIPEQDLLPTVQIIHHISLRTKLHTIHLKKAVTDADIAIELFGINPLINKTTTKPLLSTLDNIGTLFIRNIEFLDMESQQQLAEYLRYTLFRVYKSDEKIASNVQIICSSSKPLEKLVQEKLFSADLYNELVATTLTMPSLDSLSEQEFTTLTDEYAQEAVKKTPAPVLFCTLTDKEKNNLNYVRPLSLSDLKARIEELVKQKSYQQKSYQETVPETAESFDPAIVAAVQLGKKALRNQETMQLLWNTFKNQNKIATLLGVNRSSINRRCKEYQLS